MPTPNSSSPPMDLIGNLKQKMGTQPDFIIQYIRINDTDEVYGVYLDTLADQDKIQQFVLRPLIESLAEMKSPLEDVNQRVLSYISTVSFTVETDFNKGIDYILEGKCLIYIKNSSNVYVLDVEKPKHRPIEKPITEQVIRGPQEGFTEDLSTNVSLVRKRLKSPDLVFEEYTLGRITKTKVLLVYMNNKDTEKLVQDVRNRLNAIKTNSILESANIEEWIQEPVLSPFPTVFNTERPDVVAAHLIENSVVILTSGTPNALIGPITFFQFFISPEDYYQRANIATLMRLFRYISFVLSVFVPSIYIALVNYQQEVLPNELMISLSAQREGVPFPAVIEAIMMLIIFELLREAGVRMPKVSGQAIATVGAIVLGQAAVQAGLVSAAMVIVVSITAITNFVAPSFNFGVAQRFLQFGFLILAALMGLFGILSGTILLIVHLVSLKSFGYPFFAPAAPTKLKQWRDTLLRVPWPNMSRSTTKR